MTYPASAVYNPNQIRPSGPTHNEYDYHFEDWVTLRDTIMGQRQVKAQKTRYLPQRTGQTPNDYQEYLNRAVFFSITGKTLESLLGSIFRRATTFALPPALSYLLESATADGQTLSEFVEHIASENLATGRCGVLIDMASTPAQRSSTPYSLIPEKSGINKPYFAFYRTEYIMDWEWIRDPLTNERILTKVVLAEYPTNKSDTNILRVLKLDWNPISNQHEYYQYVTTHENCDSPPLEVTYPTRNGARLSRIPFFFFTPEGTDSAPAQSPLLPIAELNISHYQSYAILESARNFVGTPQYWLKQAGGTDDNTQFFVSSNKIWLLGPEDSVGLVEYHGQGLTFLENALANKEQQMASLGAKLYANQRKQAALSSVQLQNTQNSEESILLKLVNTMNHQLTRMVQTIAWWMNISEDKIKEIVVELNKNFDPPEIDARILRSLQSLYETGIYPISMLYLSYKDAGLIPADMSMAEFKVALTATGETPNTGGPTPYQPPQAAAPDQSSAKPAKPKTAPTDPKTAPSDKPSSNKGDGKTDPTN